MEIDPPSTPSTRSRSSVLSLISTFLCHPRLRKSRSHADVLNHEGASDGRKSKLSSEKSPRPSAGLARPVSALLSSNYTTSHPTPQTHYHTAHDPNADVFPTSHPQGRFSPLPPTPFSGFPKAPSSSSLNNVNTSNSGKSGAEESISEESEVVFVPRKDKGKAKALDQDAVDGFSFENENPNPNSLQALVREEEVHTDHSAFTSPDASPAVGATVPLPISTKPTPVLPTTNSNGNITTVPSPTSLPKLQTALPVPASAPASAISPSVSIRRLPPEPNAPSKVSTPIQPSPMRALPNPNGPSTLLSTLSTRS
ncbi:hypothetical protein BT69DRAFT_819948 [Atractiella rhizophila]|nr:hypothetical protein BT69DRAFT_819948 [Atractiella rhizophila]